MKNQKGITLMALTIYLIIFILVVSVVATITSYFYSNVVTFDETTKSYSEINKFNMFFLQDLKDDNILIQTIPNQNSIILYNKENLETINYTAENNGIYRNGLLIAKNIEDMRFQISSENNNILEIIITTAGKNNVAKTMKYAI